MFKISTCLLLQVMVADAGWTISTASSDSCTTTCSDLGKTCNDTAMTFPTSNDVDTVLTDQLSFNSSQSRYLHDACAEGAPQSVLVLTPFVLYDIESGHDLYNDHIDVAYASGTGGLCNSTNGPQCDEFIPPDWNPGHHRLCYCTDSTPTSSFAD